MTLLENLGMHISILLPTYRRPEQLAEALASLALQDRGLIGEILVGDDSPAATREENQRVIAGSPVAALVRYVANEPPLGNYPNQWALGMRARCDHVLILHDDDQMQRGGLALLAQACMAETDRRVKIWFGKDVIMDASGRPDMDATEANAAAFGKSGPARAMPVWEWCLTQSLPPNCSLMERETYVSLMRGERDGNVGDWGLHVRLANSGAWGRFIAEVVSRYRVQQVSMTHAGHGLDVHYMYELSKALEVPDERLADKQRLVQRFSEVATARYIRYGDKRRAWRCFASRDWRWPRRLSPRGVATMGMLMLPAPIRQRVLPSR